LTRRGEIDRKTKETEISLALELGGQGTWQGQTSVPFLDHMLNAFTRHGLFDLKIKATGDTEVDDHHTVEDIGICLGQAFRQALGDKQGITRFGSALVPMDDALALVAVDISGRAYLAYPMDLVSKFVGTFDTELVEEFWRRFTDYAAVTMHIQVLAGRNTHHIVEAIFKAVGRALRQACALDPRVQGIPSTKGKL
jgi:imidazoleglycerol-phosphate dehydratase